MIGFPVSCQHCVKQFQSFTSWSFHGTWESSVFILKNVPDSQFFSPFPTQTHTTSYFFFYLSRFLIAHCFRFLYPHVLMKEPGHPQISVDKSSWIKMEICKFDSCKAAAHYQRVFVQCCNLWIILRFIGWGWRGQGSLWVGLDLISESKDRGSCMLCKLWNPQDEFVIVIYITFYIDTSKYGNKYSCCLSCVYMKVIHITYFPPFLHLWHQYVQAASVEKSSDDCSIIYFLHSTLQSLPNIMYFHHLIILNPFLKQNGTHWHWNVSNCDLLSLIKKFFIREFKPQTLQPVRNMWVRDL